jgi:hypothetical protein
MAMHSDILGSLLIDGLIHGLINSTATLAFEG